MPLTRQQKENIVLRTNKMVVSSELTIEPQQLTESDLSGNFLDFVETEMAKTPFKVLAFKLPEGDRYFNRILYRSKAGFSDYVYNQQTIIYEKLSDGNIYRNTGPEDENPKKHSAKSILSSGDPNFFLDVDNATVNDYNEKMEQILERKTPMLYGVGGKLDPETFKGDNFENWNLRTLKNPLRGAKQMPGINKPGSILSPQGTITAMHTEDHNLMSINMMVLSEYENPEEVEIKEWLVVVPSERNLKRLKKLLNSEIYKFERQDFESGVSQNENPPEYCDAAYRQKRFVVTMKTLCEYGVEFRRIKQLPGVMVITSENLFHQILNVTKNRTYSVNCMGKSWRSRRVLLCTCAHTGQGFERRHGQIIPLLTTDKLIKAYNNRQVQAACVAAHTKESSADSSTCEVQEPPSCDIQQTSSLPACRKRNAVCKVCKAAFLNNSARNQHFKNKHATKKFRCSNCEMVFARESQRKIHFQSMHLRVKAHVCSKCGRGFRHNSSKWNHVCLRPTL